MLAFIYPLSCLLLQNLLAGALFGVRYGVPLVSLLSAIGASSCYMMSWLFGKDLVWKYFKERIQPLEAKVLSDIIYLIWVRYERQWVW